MLQGAKSEVVSLLIALQWHVPHDLFTSIRSISQRSSHLPLPAASQAGVQSFSTGPLRHSISRQCKIFILFGETLMEKNQRGVIKYLHNIV